MAKKILENNEFENQLSAKVLVDGNNATALLKQVEIAKSVIKDIDNTEESNPLWDYLGDIRFRVTKFKNDCYDKYIALQREQTELSSKVSSFTQYSVLYDYDLSQGVVRGVSL